MATIEHVQSFPIDGNNEFILLQWEGMTNGDDGSIFTLCQYADRSCQVEGTFGTGGSVVIEGSNDGINYQTLTDTQGNNLSFSIAKIEQIMEIVRFIRPRVVSGDGTTSITVSMLVRK